MSRKSAERLDNRPSNRSDRSDNDDDNGDDDNGDDDNGKSIFQLSFSFLFLFFSTARAYFSTFPFGSFFSFLSLFSLFHPAFPGAGAGNRRSAVCADGSYRYNVIADTGGGGGQGDRGAPSPPPCPPCPPGRYIDLFSSFAYELFRFGSPGVYSRMKICSAAKYFSVVARALSGRAFHASPSPLTTAYPSPCVPPYNVGQFHPACIYTRLRPDI